MRRVDLFVFLIISVVSASGQVFDLQSERLPVAELHGLCRFHTGDSPLWSQPGFDDSNWPLVRCDQSLSSQGYASYTGIAWYRVAVKVPAGHPLRGVAIPAIDDSWQLFADGVELGHFGGLPSHPAFADGFGWIAIEIPDRVASRQQTILLCLRIWHDPDWTSFTAPGLTHPMLIGDVNYLKRQEELRYREGIWGITVWCILLLSFLLAAIAGFGFFLLRPKEVEYLWFAGAEIGWAGLSAYNMQPLLGQHPALGYEVVLGISLLTIGICWPNFLATFLKEPKGKAYWAAVATGILSGLIFIPLLFEWISAGNWLTPYYTIFWVQAATNVLLVLTPARRGSLDARLLLVPVILDPLQRFAGWVPLLAQVAGRQELYSRLDRWVNESFMWPFPLGCQTITYLLAQFAIVAILILRFARSRSDEERVTGELEAARQVQQILIPQEIPSVPGFQIDALYKPAGEVGGDFFQIIPTQNGGVLVTVGDVSGKGMPAAMMVSLLVGTFRTLAYYTQNPGEILAAMNRRMLARSKGGFTTCLVLRLDPDGAFTVANAGHLSPYCNGEELALDGGLPLGLHAESTYPEAVFTLKEGAQLTLLTDGVVEARSNTGELFGFTRTQTMSCKSAQQILEAACVFGQEDDITVVTLTPTVSEVMP